MKSSERSTLLVSIRPRFVDLILSGSKQVELRRRAPKCTITSGLIYATSPRKEIVASFCIESIVSAPLFLLWEDYRNVAGVSREEYEVYFSGLREGNAIIITNVQKFDRPIPLDELRGLWCGFRPPQSYCYLNTNAVTQLRNATS